MHNQFLTRVRRLEAITPDPTATGRVFRQVVHIGEGQADAERRARTEGYGERPGDLLILRTIVAPPVRSH